MYHAEAKHRHVTLHVAEDEDVPPTWAVVVVKTCVIGLLLLPVAVLLWSLMYTPADGVGFAPVAFFGSILLGLGMFVTAAYLTSTFPPVPSDDDP